MQNLWKQFEQVINENMDALKAAYDRNPSNFDLLDLLNISAETLVAEFDEFFLWLEEMSRYEPHTLRCEFLALTFCEGRSAT